MNTHLIDIDPDGTMTSLGNPLKLKGTITSKRWSTIKPVSPLLRLLFNTVRYCFGDNGGMAAWSRRWPCFWELHIPSLNWSAQCNHRLTLIAIEREKYYATNL